MIHAPRPSLVGGAAIHALKDAFDRLDHALVEAMQEGIANGGGRELQLARTNLEQASMWATKAVCIAYPEAQK